MYKWLKVYDHAIRSEGYPPITMRKHSQGNRQKEINAVSDIQKGEIYNICSMSDGI